ncbi:MAG: hypothetical protein JNK74_05075 [Candidatus Hydrogenedentes bacterium]|nr:hypothetical protein [Candidatus Hydrogenedentota bacterium]
MSGHPPHFSGDEGMAYVALLFLLVILLTLGLSFIYSTSSQTASTMGRTEQMQAQYLAESAVNHALWRLKNEEGWAPDASTYYMHDTANGRYGYKVRPQTDAEPVTVATVGVVGESVVRQSYVLNLVPATQSYRSRLYWTDQSSAKVQRAALDGTEVEDLATGQSNVGGLAFDERGAKVYWVDKNAKAIRRANVDGSDPEDCVSGLADVTAITIDSAGGKLYWADRATKKIQRASLNGANIQDIIVANAANVAALALDLVGGRLYWADITTTRIRRSTLDGASIAVLSSADAKNVSAMLVDAVSAKIYWADRDNDKVMRANLDGTSRQTLATGVKEPTALAVNGAGGQLYWSDSSTGVIRRANLDGTGATDIVTGQGAIPAMVIDATERRIFWADSGAKAIRRAALDGSALTDLVAGIADLRYMRLGTIEAGVHFQSFTEARQRDAKALSTLSIETPDDVYEGDLLIAAVATDGDTTGTLSPPAGESWKALDLGHQGGQVTFGAWWKLAAADEPLSHDFTWETSQAAYGWMMRFTGHDHAMPIDTSAVTGLISALPIGSIVIPRYDNTMVLRLGAFDGNQITPGLTGLAGHADIVMGASNQDIGLLGHWRFDELLGKTAYDSSGHRYDAKLANMTGLEWTPGMVNGALTFDGVNDVAQGPVSESALAIAADYTATVWLYADPVQTAGAGIFNRRDSTAKLNHFALEFATDAERHLKVVHGTSATVWQTDCTLDEFAGDWHHLAVTYEPSTSTAQLYLDGALRSQNLSFKTPPASGAGRFYIGRSRNSGNTRSFKGKIDDLRIYNRLLSRDDIVSQMGTKVVYRGYREARAGVDQTGLTIATPDLATAGDLLVAAVATDGNTASSLTPPSGWTAASTSSYDGKVTLGVWWKLVAAKEPATHEFVWKTPEQAYGWIMRFTGHDSATPIHAVAAAGATDATPSGPEIDTSLDYTMIVRIGAFDQGDIVEGNPGLSGHQAINMGRSSSVAGVSHLGFQEAKLNAGGTVLDIGLPASTAENDLLIAAVAVGNPVVASLSAPMGGGWTLLDRSQQGDVTLGVWWKIAGASESATHGFTWSGASKAYGWISRFTGHNPTNPIDAFATGGGLDSSTPTTPSVTTTVPDTLILRIGGFEDDDVRVDNPGLTGHTTITMDKSGTASKRSSGGAAYKQQAIAGASGTANFSLTTKRGYRTLTLAITPAPGTTGEAVSGGAGFHQLPGAGTSAASDFQLYAERAAQMVTIAIAPSPVASAVSGGAGYLYQKNAGISGAPSFLLKLPEESRVVTVVLKPEEQEKGL